MKCFASPVRRLCIIAALCLFTGQLQAQLVFKESFETPFSSNGWTISASSGNVWQVSNVPGYAYSGTGCLFGLQSNAATQSWAYSPAQALVAGVSYRLSYWYKKGSNGTGKLKATLGTAANPAGQTLTITQQLAVTNDAYMEATGLFSVPAPGNYHIAINNFSDAFNPALMVDSVVLTQIAVCSGIPEPGIITGPYTFCAGDNIQLRLSGNYTASGLTFQWQSSSSGLPNDFTSIAGATNNTLSLTQTTATWYRCLVTCSGQTASTPVYALNDSACFCKPFSSCSGGQFISNVKFGSIDYTTNCTSGGYSDYTGSVLPATINAGTNIPFTLTFTSNGLNSAGIWIDYNDNSLFEPNEFTNFGDVQLPSITTTSRTITRNVYLPTSLNGGYFRMRVRLLAYGSLLATEACTTKPNGETEDYMVNIVQSKVSIVYSGQFRDTAYTQKLKLRAQIRQTDVGIDTGNLLKPKIWAASYNTSVGLKSFKGTLIAGTVNDGTWEFEIDHDSLGVIKNGCDSILYYFVAQDKNIPFNLGYFPEIGTQHTNVNTVVALPAVPLGYRLVPNLKDTIYISYNNCRYNSLSGAVSLFQDINTRGLEGNLTVIVNGNLSEETGQYPLNGEAMNGYGITIRPGDAVVKNIGGYNQQKSLIRLNGVKNFVIDGSFNGSGRYLRFYNYVAEPFELYDTLGWVKIYNSSENITLTNITFQLVPGNNTYNYMHAVLLTDGNNKNILIKNNLFREQYSVMPGGYIAAIRGNNQLTIQNNEFVNFSKRAIDLKSPAYNCIVDSNHLYRTLSPSPEGEGGAIRVSGGGHRISNNYVGGSMKFAGGQAMRFIDYSVADIAMIEVAGPAGAVADTIANNRVDNIHVSYNTTYPSRTFAGILNNENNSYIYNNVVGNPQADTATIVLRVDYAYGIQSYGEKGVRVINNIVTGLSEMATQSIGSIDGIDVANNAGGTTAALADFEVSGNKVYDIYSNTNSYGCAGIRARGGLNNNFFNNEVYNITVAKGSLIGFAYSSHPNSIRTIINNNKIYKLTNNSGQTGCCGNQSDEGYGRIAGISYSNNNTAIEVYNNQVSIDNNGQPNPVSMRGIELRPSGSTAAKDQLSYNSIYVGGVSAGVAGSAAIHCYAAMPRIFANNFLYNTRSGGSKGHFIYRFSDALEAVLANMQARNNLYVVTDTSRFGRLTDTHFYGWESWKTKATNDSVHYLTTTDNLPGNIFVNAPLGDLHINTSEDKSWYLNGKGIPLPNIASDIDSSNIRSVNITTGATDIGADEFDTNTLPPVLVVYGRHEPGGADTLTLNGRIMAVINWENQGVLPALQTSRFYSGQWPNDISNAGLNPQAKTFNSWWHIPVTGGSNYAYRVTLYFDSSMLGRTENIPSLAINKKTEGINGSWQMLLPSTVANNNLSIESGILTDFSEFTVTNISDPLGVSIASSCAGGNTQLNAYPTGTGNSYQWQADDGTGFTDLQNDAYYSGVQTSLLNIAGLPAVYNRTIYRCRISNGSTNSYSSPVQLKMVNEWKGTADNNWFNVANWSCAAVPDNNTDVVIKGNVVNNPVISVSTSCRSLQVYSGGNVVLQNGAVLTLTGK